jgi:hypothetical protein
MIYYMQVTCSTVAPGIWGDFTVEGGTPRRREICIDLFPHTVENTAVFVFDLPSREEVAENDGKG